MGKEFGKEFQWDGFKGPPKHDYDVIGGYAPTLSAAPRSGKPTGKGEQPTRKGKN